MAEQNSISSVPTKQAELAAAQPARGQLAGALARAQQRCRPAPHDRRNTFHGYDYSSAESVIETARQALAESGLALLPVRQSLVGWEREGENRFELERQFVLLHASGETCPVVVNWPVVPDKGRPLDKAVASAATTSLAYLLRDMLMMARVDPADDLAGREDRPATKAAPAKRAAPQKQAVALPQNGEELRDRLGAYEEQLVAKKLCDPGDLLAHVRE